MNARTALFALACLALPLAAGSLDEALAPVAEYDYHDDRAVLFAFEELAAKAPAADVEAALIRFVGGETSRAGREYVCRRLSLVGTEKAVPALARLLRDPASVEMARYALERIPGDASLRALRESLAAAPKEARPGIVNTLGVRGDAAATPLLTELARGDDAALSGAAVGALGRIATPAAIDTLQGIRASEGAEEALLVAAETLLDAGQKERASEIFGSLRGSEDPFIRVGALRGLVECKAPEAVEALQAALGDPRESVRASGVKLLAGLADPKARRLLSASLESPSADLRVQVVTALAEREGRAALPELMKAADDVAEPVRIAALLALSRAADASAVEALTARAASEQAADVEREAARRALARAPGEDVDAVIVESLKEASGARRIELLEAASARSIRAATPAFLTAAKDADRDVRRAGFRALRETAGDEDIPPLLALLEESKGGDRREAERVLAAALPRASQARVDDVVAAYRSAANPAAKASMLQVMGLSGSANVLPVLREALAVDDDALKRSAILALTEWPDPAPMTDLLLAAKSAANPAHRVLAHRGYLQLMERPNSRGRSESVEALAEAMAAAPGPDEKKAVLGLLARYAVPEALALAEEAAKDPEVAAEAKLAAERIRSGMAP